MPGSIESTSPDHRTVNVPPRVCCFAGCCLVLEEPQAASASAANGTKTSVFLIVPAIGWDIWPLTPLSAADERQSVLERLCGGRTDQWVGSTAALVAVRLAGPVDRFVDALERQVGERVGAHLGGHLGLRAVVGDHLLARRHV